MARVLVVEDNPVNMKLMVVVLEKYGYQAIQAVDAESALVVAREQPPDLILMDVQLPGMDGLQATGLLKSNPETARIPVIALTAMAMLSDEQRIRDAGCDGYIPKPIDYKGFLAEVERTLARHA